jgi:hypothetical protein
MAGEPDADSISEDFLNVDDLVHRMEFRVDSIPRLPCLLPE